MQTVQHVCSPPLPTPPSLSRSPGGPGGPTSSANSHCRHSLSTAAGRGGVGVVTAAAGTRQHGLLPPQGRAGSLHHRLAAPAHDHTPRHATPHTLIPQSHPTRSPMSTCSKLGMCRWLHEAAATAAAPVTPDAAAGAAAAGAAGAASCCARRACSTADRGRLSKSSYSPCVDAAAAAAPSLDRVA
jgi:hypothetical protein